jgi:hypothetical protein
MLLLLLLLLLLLYVSVEIGFLTSRFTTGVDYTFSGFHSGEVSDCCLLG